MKKIFLIMIINVAILLFAHTVVNASTNEIQLNPSSESVKTGETFTVILSAQSSEGINAIYGKEEYDGFKINYDSNKLELIKGEAKSAENLNDGLDSIVLIYFGNDIITSGDFYEWSFKAKDDINDVATQISTTELILENLADQNTTVDLGIKNTTIGIRRAPQLSVNTSVSETKEYCVATITADEDIELPNEEWTYSEQNDKKVITKTYRDNTTEEVTVKDLDGNETKITVQITQIEKIFNSNIYNIEENKIKNIQPNINLDQLAQNISSNQQYTIKEDGREISNTDMIKTGQVLIVGNQSYTLIVTGDVNGDGRSNIQDILEVNRHRLNKKVLTDSFFEAADTNNDKKVDIRDLLQLNRLRLGK